MQLIMGQSLLNRPLASSKNRNFQNEAKSKIEPFCDNEFHLYQNKKDFHITCFALSLALKKRLRPKLGNGLATQQ